MKAVYLSFVLCLSLVFLAQNCTQFESQSFLSNQIISSIYPYPDDAPLYFADSQFVDKLEINGGIDTGFSYQIISSVVSAVNEEELLSVDIIILNPDGESVCPRVSRTVNNAQNHIEIDDCISNFSFEEVTVKILVTQPNGSTVEARSQSFNISDI